VSSECTSFRAALEAELLGRPSQERLAWLSWNEHLLGCADCRELLQKEEALEVLLATLPEPRLPAALLERVLRRLRRDLAEETRLEKLLDLDRELDPDAVAHARSASGLRRREDAPPGLAAEILARLEPERRVLAASSADARLDALLDIDREIAVPSGLAGRTLRSLALARRAPRRKIGRLVAAAAGIALLFFGRIAWLRVRSETRPGAQVERSPELAARDAEPDPQMLAALDVVEQWDLLMQDDVDVLLSTLGPGDEALLDYR
jgi:hypothetical protein